jgi:hypothetical protein
MGLVCQMANRHPDGLLDGMGIGFGIPREADCPK